MQLKKRGNIVNGLLKIPFNFRNKYNQSQPLAKLKCESKNIKLKNVFWISIRVNLIKNWGF